MNNIRLPIKQFSKKEIPGSNDGEKRFSDEELAEIRREIGNRLKEAFNTENASEIGRRLMTAPNVAQNYMDGARFPAPEMLLQFRRATGFSIDWLLTGEGSKFLNVKSVFSEKEEQQISELARAAGRTFSEEVRRLALSGMAAIEKYQS